MPERKLSKKEITQKYDFFAKYYDFAEILTRFFIASKRKTLIKRAKGKVLEVGVGTGVNFKYYSKDCKIAGIDLSREMLKHARRRAQRLGINIELNIGDAEKLPFKQKSFDSVVDTLGLCTYTDPIRVLKEMKRVCKKNGEILFLEHGISNNSFIRKLQQMREEKHYQRIGCSLIRNPEQLLIEAGLKIVGAERSLFGIIYLIIAKP